MVVKYGSLDKYHTENIEDIRQQNLEKNMWPDYEYEESWPVAQKVLPKTARGISNGNNT